MNPSKVFFVLGGPGSGKGTQCGLLSKELGIHHISAGDCLRDERDKPDSLYGSLISNCIVEGTIVPVEVTCALLRKRIEKLGLHDNRFLIDGFPRNKNNLDGWNQHMKDIVVPFCIFIDCPEEIMKERLLKRREICNRDDDNIQSILKRFKTFSEETIPIIKKFQEMGKCRVIDGSKNVDEVYQNLRQLFFS